MDLPSVFRVELLDGFTLRPVCRSPQLADGVLPRGVQRLVAFLGLSRRPARPAVAGQLWPDVPEDRAQASLRSALWRLRRATPGLVEASGGALSLAAGVRVDVRELHCWTERALEPRTRVDQLTLPVPPLRGDLLPGWYDDWVLLERERLRQHRMHALEAVAARFAAAGRHGAAVQAAHLAIQAEPLRESAHRTLVRVHLAEGNLAEALRAYHFFRDMLRNELGVPPTEQMTRLVQGLPSGCQAAS
ncbi:BTAD domain-containing putative transcriptional regulator [Geodermatophilus sp. SYSU D00703]